MKTLTLFTMTRRGYQLLADTVEAFRPLFSKVVIGRDAALDDDYCAQTAALCEEHRIPWCERGSHHTTVTEYAMAVGWRWMIDFDPTRLIVFHDSLLPRYRGFNPLVSCLINGDTRLGVTALFGATDYDRGDIISQHAAEIAYPCTIARAIEEVAACYRAAAYDVLNRVASGTPLTGTPQDESAASYSLWRDEADYRIDWHDSATRLERCVDALGSPYSGACTLVNGSLAKVLAARALPDVAIENRTAGKVLRIEDGRPVVVCDNGLLRIDALVDAASGASLLPLARLRSRFA